MGYPGGPHQGNFIVISQNSIRIWLGERKLIMIVRLHQSFGYLIPKEFLVCYHNRTIERRAVPLI